MTIFKCKMCGGTLEFNPGDTVAVCDSCGTKQTLPKLDDDRRANLYDRANHFRRSNEYDKAMGIYEQILAEDNTDAEAYWSLVLCRYGIEYVEDPATHRRVPTMNRAQFTSIFDDDNYKSALHYADAAQREVYESEAKAINEIQKGILAISQKEQPFDVFICYKETDAGGRRTPDSVLANDLYHQLTQEGFKVFFARITLEDKLGTAYEPYIFAALNSAKVMVVLGTKPEYFNAVWVKNEWSRYLALVKNSGGKKMLIPAYKDMDPYDLPEEFSHLQAQDMGKLGFMQDLIRGIKKIISADAPKAAVKETVVVSGGNAAVEPLLKRAFMFLEDGNWQEADTYCEKVLDQDPENARAYLGKLMAELQVHTQEDLSHCEELFNDNNNYRKAMRFADEDVQTLLSGAICQIQAEKYKKAIDLVESPYAYSSDYIAAASIFESLSDYKDAEVLASECRNNPSKFKYACAKRILDNPDASARDYEKAASILSPIIRIVPGAMDLYDKCRILLLCAKARSMLAAPHVAAESYLMMERDLEQISDCEDAERLAKECWEKYAEKMYSQARQLMDSSEYKSDFQRAASILQDISGYKDASSLIAECHEKVADIVCQSVKNTLASPHAIAGDYERAIAMLETVAEYKDVNSLIAECHTKAADAKYQCAKNVLNAPQSTADDYEQAATMLETIAEYKDANSLIAECHTKAADAKYQCAKTILNTPQSTADDYEQAAAMFESVAKYKDTSSLIAECHAKAAEKIAENKYLSAEKYLDSAKKQLGSPDQSVTYYKQAALMLEQLSGYRDVDEKMKFCNEKIQELHQAQLNNDIAKLKKELFKATSPSILFMCSAILMLLLTILAWGDSTFFNAIFIIGIMACLFGWLIKSDDSKKAMKELKPQLEKKKAELEALKKKQ